MIRSRQTAIARRLTERLKLDPAIAQGVMALFPFIVGITDLDELLKDWDVYNTGNVAYVGTGTQTLLTIPSGERWEIVAYSIGIISGDREVVGDLVYDADGHYTYIAQYTATSRRNSGVLGQSIIMEQDWTFRVTISGGTTDGNMEGLFLVKRQKAF